jgi:hypothetical protein
MEDVIGMIADGEGTGTRDLGTRELGNREQLLLRAMEMSRWGCGERNEFGDASGPIRPGSGFVLFGSELADYGDGGGSADAVGAGFEEGADVGEGADATGGFDAGARAGDTTEDGNIGCSCAAGGEAGGGLEEVGTGLYGDLGAAKFFFDGEQAGFKDDFKDCAVMVGYGGGCLDGVVYRMVIAALELADGDHHIEFADAEAGEGGCLLAKCGDQRSAEGKTDHYADGNAGAGEKLNGGGGPDGIDHGAGETVADGFIAEVFNLVARGVGLEEGVVNDRGEVLPTGESVCGKGSGIERAVVELEV